MGLAIGLTTALILSRYMSSLLFGVGTRDPITLIVLPLGLLAVAAIATYSGSACRTREPDDGAASNGVRIVPRLHRRSPAFASGVRNSKARPSENQDTVAGEAAQEAVERSRVRVDGCRELLAVLAPAAR